MAAGLIANLAARNQARTRLCGRDARAPRGAHPPSFPFFSPVILTPLRAGRPRSRGCSSPAIPILLTPSFPRLRRRDARAPGKFAVSPKIPPKFPIETP